MKYIKQFDLPYTEPDSQYDSVDFAECDMVEAEYIPVNGFHGKPDIEALPKPFTAKEAFNRGMYIPPALMDAGTDTPLKIYAMRSLRVPMLNQGMINQRLYEGLVLSYSNREYAVTERKVKVERDEKKLDVNIISTSYLNSTTLGSAIIGLPGTGKSTALNIALQRYPRAIVHKLEGGYYIQVPIIRTTAYANSNLSALFVSFANSLDMILDTGHTHRNILKSANVGRMAEQVIDWIRRYHIGAWIIEEIEFFTFGSDKNSSFENVVTIMQESGIFLFVTGNDDLKEKIHGNLRQERRFLSNYIDMNKIPKDKDFMQSVVGRMWEYMLPDMQNTLTEDIFEIIYYWTLGSIDMISILLVSLQQEYYRLQRKGEAVSVTKEFVEKIAKEKLGRMHELFLEGQTEAADGYLEERKKFDSMVTSMVEQETMENMKVHAMIKEELEAGYDHTTKYLMVREAILDFTDDYSEKKIESAFSYCEKNAEGFKHMSNRDMKRVVLEQLKKTGKKKTEKRQQSAKDSIDMLCSELTGGAVS